ncbi:uncharacterized protein LOC113140702 isoform X1 [Mastacembelus armatus]|uniref:uncharacterized protein LOC113140702 isoform X1 n=1 Tax=Mastacembelus armatus TaxID=205130 RepID=UPI001436886E|nr:uncharacterized protein LOC113140702 isoform X1 [Mastacembelus armatus]
MDLTSFYPLLYMLSINPNRSQFFRYDYISLTCAPSKWTVKRNTSQRTSQTCNRDFGALQQSSCNLMNVYPSDSGVYWCESEQKQRSNILNITVAAGPVILEMPPLPVTEGDEVVLRCSFKEKSTPKSPSFYKNDVFIGTESEGKMILPAVSKSDEGFYKCQHPTEGESPQSFLAVIGGGGRLPFPWTLPPAHPGDTEAFPGQASGTVLPACPGSSPGPFPGATCPEHLPLHRNGSVHQPHFCCQCTDPSISRTLHPSLTREQDPKILKLRADLIHPRCLAELSQ